MAPAGDASAAALDTQYNPVANGAITVAPGDNDRSDWAGIPAYPLDPTGDAAAIDYESVQIAHDDDNFYFHFQFAPQASPQFYGFQHNLYLDTDLDRGTGFIGGGGFLSLGADYLVQGTSNHSCSRRCNEYPGGTATSPISDLPADNSPPPEPPGSRCRTAAAVCAAGRYIVPGR